MCKQTSSQLALVRIFKKHIDVQSTAWFFCFWPFVCEVLLQILLAWYKAKLLIHPVVSLNVKPDWLAAGGSMFLYIHESAISLLKCRTLPLMSADLLDLLRVSRILMALFTQRLHNITTSSYSQPSSVLPWCHHGPSLRLSGSPNLPWLHKLEAFLAVCLQLVALVGTPRQPMFILHPLICRCWCPRTRGANGLFKKKKR